jgi:hypothetical protein
LLSSLLFYSLRAWIKSVGWDLKKWMLKDLPVVLVHKMIVFGAWQFSTLLAKQIK